MKTVIVLPDIRSSLNVGSIFRTVDAVGVAKIYLAGYTPAPVDKFGRIDKQIAKTALGAEKTVAWEKVESLSKLLTKLKKEKFYLIAVEQDKNSIDYKKITCLPAGRNQKTKRAFVFGNEVAGLSKTILQKCDIIAEIPMKGDKESLNVSVSAGVVLFRILDS